MRELTTPLSDKIAAAATQNTRERDYWLKKLSGIRERPGLFFDHRESTDSGTAHTRAVSFEVSPSAAAQVLKLSKNSPYTLFIVLVSAIAAVLDKYLEEEDIVVGTSIYRQETQGDFINTVLALRITIDDRITFKELLLQARQTIIEANENQNYPIEVLAYHLGLQPPGGNHFPLFDVMVLLENIHCREYTAHIRTNAAFFFQWEDGRIHSRLEYNPAVCGETYMQRLSAHVLRFLEAAVNSPDQPLEDIDMLTETEKQQLLEEFNRNRAAFPGNRLVFHYLEENAGTHPDRAAVNLGDQEVTYRRLNTGVNRMALRLKTEGFKRGEITALLLERSIQALECMLATWKVGGAYIPIDPHYPLSRITGILADSNTPLLLTRQSLCDSQVRESYRRHILWLDTPAPDREEIDPGAGSPGLEIDKSDLAYIIYTSGSTGNPKGALVEHIGMMNHLHAKIKDLQLNSSSIIAQNAPYTFDISVWQNFVAVVVGGKTVIFPDELLLKPEKFLLRAAARRVTVLEVVPSYLSALLESPYLDPGKLTTLTCLVATGELLPSALVKQWFQRFPHIPLINAYGPTEASDDITHHIMVHDPKLERIPIGKPVQNFKILILDRDKHLCPIGKKGEIFVTGPGIGRGYLNNPEKTAQAFYYSLPSAPGDEAGRRNQKEYPVQPEAAYRLYRTGDVGSWREDGTIDFFGRNDSQVKIRGFRIELGEIENALIEHPSVRASAVLDRTDSNGSKFLCAYVVTQHETDIPAIRAYLEERLPGYMVPAHFTRVEKIPLTPNGKVDRNALPVPVLTGTDLQGIRTLPEPPGSEYEKILAGIWQKVLGIPGVGINQNFFQLGGDSIKAVQVDARLQHQGLKIELEDLFLYPEIKKLAKHVHTFDSPGEEGADILEGEVPLTPVQRLFFENRCEEPHHFNLAVMAYAPGRFDIDMIRAVFGKLLEHHDALRSTFHDIDGDVYQVYHGIDRPIALERFDFIHSTDWRQSIEEKANEVQASIDLGQGPLMKLALFHAPGGDYLLIAAHHLVIDVVSWRILFVDIENLMEQYSAGSPLKLPRKTTSNKKWVRHLQEYTETGDFREEIRYWQNQFTTPIPGIPRDYPAGANRTCDTQRLSIRLSAAETGKLQAAQNRAFAGRLKEILLTGLVTALSQTFGLEKVVVMLEGHGREALSPGIDVSRTVGWFTSFYPVIFDSLSLDDNNPGNQIRRVTEKLQKVPGNGIGWGLLKYYTNNNLKSGIPADFVPQVGFNFLGDLDEYISRMFEPSTVTPGQMVGPRNRREFEIEVLANISGKRLNIHIEFSQEQYKTATITLLRNRFHTAIKKIIGGIGLPANP